MKFEFSKEESDKIMASIDEVDEFVQGYEDLNKEILSKFYPNANAEDMAMGAIFKWDELSLSVGFPPGSRNMAREHIIVYCQTPDDGSYLCLGSDPSKRYECSLDGLDDIRNEIFGTKRLDDFLKEIFITKRE